MKLPLRPPTALSAPPRGHQGASPRLLYKDEGHDGTTSVGEKTMSALEKIAVASLLFAMLPARAFADGPPKLEVTTTCNGAAR
jgi:hypothetical protein